MERWSGKVAVVTGAGSGIGAAVTRALIKNGMKVVGVDVSEQRLKDVAKTLEKGKEEFHKVTADVRKENEILQAFNWIDKHLGGIHVMVNCAGVLAAGPISETPTDQMEKVLDVNVLALTICSREAIKSMNKHKIDDGNIINLASIVARISTPPPGFVMYVASKKAVLAITEGIRIELAHAKSNIKITSICPGITASTNIFKEVGVSVPAKKPFIQPENVADTIIFCLQMPPEVQITELHVRPVREDLGEAWE